MKVLKACRLNLKLLRNWEKGCKKLKLGVIFLPPIPPKKFALATVMETPWI
jgi:hypothetical protein